VAQLQPDLVARIRTQRRGAWRPREPGASWRGEPQLPAGARLLELQAACPYRAYAELRLDAVALGEPAPGIDPRVRGQLLHAALEHLWRQLGDQPALLQLSADAAVAACEAAAAAAVQRIVPRLPWPPEIGLLRRERSRIARLLLAELEWERRRPTFRAERLEYQTVLPLGEHTLALRIDRVDRLEDDRLLIIDYKSGAPARFDAEAARLPQPQLPAYAVALGTEVAAVASLHLRPEGVKARGLADSVERCGVTGSARPWDDQLQLWSAQLRELGDEFVAGQASVTPLEGVCRYCHLAYCCRISAVALEANGESGDVPTDEVAHGPA
jgi:RecB family exonuclease